MSIKSPTNIEAMEAGVELDALLAEHVMGWSVKLEQHPAYITPRLSLVVFHNRRFPRVGPPENRYDAHWDYSDWTPSKDIAAAWQVFEKMVADGWQVGVVSMDATWDASVSGDRRMYEARAATAPLAMCKACLLALRSTQSGEEEGS